uniref:Uncharacterized protein n=1 Tax=Onchocerca volvulus TaxID=6282 RepID=A0A8R1TWS1_ONCVO
MKFQVNMLCIKQNVYRMFVHIEQKTHVRDVRNLGTYIISKTFDLSKVFIVKCMLIFSLLCIVCCKLSKQ